MDISEQSSLEGRHAVTVVRAGSGGGDPVAWARANGPAIEALLADRGALCVKGLPVGGSKQLDTVLSSLFGEPLVEYEHPSTPRTRLRGGIYTSTEYHAAKSIPLHNENSYSHSWPLRIGFYCALPSSWGGATPIADSRQVYKRMPTEVLKAFEHAGVMYERNYSNIDLPWRDVFGTHDRQEVEAYCRRNGIEYEWCGYDELRTRQIGKAVRYHPVSGVPVWFNQAHLFHVSSLHDEDRSALSEVLGNGKFPRNAYFGDGMPIDGSLLDEVRRVYDEERITLRWEKHDLLLLDNMLFCHGREPFEGERKVLVGMARAHGQ